jgi:hypothetical protein
MNIEFYNYDYEVLDFFQNAPIVHPGPAFQAHSMVTHDLHEHAHARGIEVVTRSSIRIPLRHNDQILDFFGETRFLIPHEQGISRQMDAPPNIAPSILTELLHSHLSRQSSIIFVDTFNNHPETGGYKFAVPSIYDLYKSLTV